MTFLFTFYLKTSTVTLSILLIVSVHGDGGGGGGFYNCSLNYFLRKWGRRSLVDVLLWKLKKRTENKWKWKKGKHDRLRNYKIRSDIWTWHPKEEDQVVFGELSYWGTIFKVFVRTREETVSGFRLGGWCMHHEFAWYWVAYWAFYLDGILAS